MITFDAELRGLADRLDLPEPMRSRTLLELRSDLEAMAAALESRGVAEAEARRRALESLLPTPGAVRELRQVHRPLYQRLADRFSARGRHRLERALLGFVAVAYLAGGLVTLAQLDLLTAPSAFLWPVLVLSGLIATVGAAKLFQLFVAGTHGAGLRRGLGTLLALAATTLVVAFSGTVADFYTAAGRLAAGAPQAPELLAWLRQATTLLVVALLAASVAGLIWLVAAVRIARSEQAEAAALGLTERRGDP